MSKGTTQKLDVGNQAFLKRKNRTEVLSLLRKHGGLSRARLSKLTMLDGKTITNASNDLLGLGMIRPVGIVTRGVGRPSEILDVDPGFGVALGIDVGANHIAGVAVDFSGEILQRARTELRYGSKPPTVMKHIIDMGNSLLEKRGLRRKKLLGVGLCVPGVVDTAAGIGVRAVNLAEWINVPLSAPLKEAFGTEIAVEESTRAMALGEMFGRVRENLRDALLLDLSTGIGAALVQKGQLHYGHTGMAGEIGHTTIVPGGRQCRCGKKGCLEAEASGNAVAEVFREAIAGGAKSKWLASSGISVSDITARDVAEGARAGDPLCEKIFSGAARMLGLAAANAVHLLDPASLILAGGMVRAGDIFLRPFKDELQKGLMVELRDSLKVEVSPLGDDGGPLGAASLILTRTLPSRD